ncbi:MAG: bifunctional UDP-sugar hydrolase/5'-nucleotidase [bacterium]
MSGPAYRPAVILAAMLCTFALHGCTSGGIPRTATHASGQITILHTNDIHGDLSPFVVDTGDATSQTGDPGRSPQEYPRHGTIGGFARLATAVERVRATHMPRSVLLVDAGDTFGDGLLANLTRGAATLRLMDALGYTFMALGNHDYEYTTDRTRELQGMVRFPMRAANAVVKSTEAPFLGDPTLVVHVNGIRVGLLALTYHNTDQTGNRDNTRDLSFGSGLEAARKYVPILRARSDVVVVVSHQGTAVDSLLGEQVPGIDIIVGGHSHDRITPPRRVGGAWMVQALSDASALGELTVNVTDGRVTGVAGVVHELYADSVAPDPRFAAMLDSIRAPFRDTLEAIIATAADRIGRQYKSESPVDALAADLLRQYGNADVAFLPGLGFGVTMQPGPITREMLVSFFPHPTSVMHEVLTGRQILRILEQSATNLLPADPLDRVGGLIQTAGLRWTIDLTRPAGQRTRDVQVGARALEPDRHYTVMTNGGLLQGTHRQATFAEGSDIVRDPRTFVAVLEAAVRAMGVVHAPRLGAITLIR